MWTLALTGALAVLAWLYQRAWERQRAREDAYGRILDQLPGLFVTSHDPEKIERLIGEMRRMLLFAPDDVVRKGEAFLVATESGGDVSDADREAALDTFIMAMRQDCTFSAMIRPGLWKSRLTSTRIALKSPPKRTR